MLWVDDHPENNVYPRRAMEAVGIRITLSKSTEDALEKVHSYAYDVIISDMGRQPPDPQAPHDYRAGYNLLDKLRDQHIFTPFIIYAGSSSAEEQEETRRRGGFGTTNDTDVLLQMVISAIEQPASRSAAETEAVVEEVAEEAEDVVEGTGERVEDISMASERVRQAAEQVISRSAAETEAPQTVEEKWKEVGDGYASAGHYELAIAAYQTALPSYPQAAFPAEWANLQARLGDAYSMRVEGSRQDNLERAVAYYQAALQVSTRAVFPTQWAELQQKLRDASRAYEQRRMVAANLDQLIETVKSQMQPPPRAMATASTLQQLSTFIPDEVTLADLVVGWQALSHSSEEKEEPAISQRRVTCGELANMASQFTTDQGKLAQTIKAWQYWLEAFKNSGDPRQEAMAKTFDRELKELESEEFESEEPESKEL